MSALLAYAQPGRELPTYEVASIKANTDGDFRLAFDIRPDGTLTATGITLKRLLMTAYNVQGFRLVGGPSWVGSDRWDLQAKPNRVTSPADVRQMLRTLLEDRFQLRSHPETRKLPVYELAVDRRGVKFQKAKDGAEPAVEVTSGSIHLRRATAATFASQLSYALGRPVINKTGLSGEFDFALEWTPEPGVDGGPSTAGLPPGTVQPPASAPEGPSIFTAILEQLGLRLKSGRAPVEVIVIDAAKRPTAD